MGKSNRKQYNDFEDEEIRFQKKNKQKKNKKFKNALRSKDIEYLTKLDDEEF